MKRQWKPTPKLSVPLLILLITAGFLSGLSIVGCSQTNPFLVTPQKGKQTKISDHPSSVTFNPKVDILFVVDDSGSMSDKQANVIANAQLFINEFQKNRFLDYHIGVVTSSAGASWEIGKKGGNGKLVGKTARFIDRYTPNGLQIFQDNIDCGISGSGLEKFFDPIHLALTEPLLSTYNAGFLRADAHLATIFLTDADDQSKQITSASTFYNFLVNDLKSGNAKKVHNYAVYIPTVDQNCERSGEPLPDRIEELLKMSKGGSFDLCDVDFGTKLAGIAADLVSKVGQTVYLTSPPVPETIEVHYGTQFIPSDKYNGWRFDPAENAIIFGPGVVWTEQPEGTQLQVDFTAAVYP